MESVEQLNIKKLCNFYVSDLHLSVMLLPYINNEINEDVEVTTIFESSERENIESVIEKLNVKNKDKILNLNWYNTNNTNEKIENTMDENINNQKKNTIIIGGKKDYISKINKKIINYIEINKIKKEDIKIIDCYNVNEVGNEIKQLVEKYDAVLNTMGETIIN